MTAIYSRGRLYLVRPSQYRVVQGTPLWVLVGRSCSRTARRLQTTREPSPFATSRGKRLLAEPARTCYRFSESSISLQAHHESRARRDFGVMIRVGNGAASRSNRSKWSGQSASPCDWKADGSDKSVLQGAGRALGSHAQGPLLEAGSCVDDSVCSRRRWSVPFGKLRQALRARDAASQT
jgi:hypothetical protein